jgi:hypothetical protein
MRCASRHGSDQTFLGRDAHVILPTRIAGHTPFAPGCPIAMIELISVHVPKCAGSSLGSALAGVYGAEAIFVDNASTPGHPNSPANLDPVGYFESFRDSGYPFLRGKRAVHGHFHIRKYDFFTERCLRVTFLRHPVARTISHFRYWQQHPRRGHPLHHYMLDNGLDVVRFAQMPLIRHFYSRTFFGGVERSRFDFVGCVEAADRDLPRLTELIGHSLNMPIENVTPRGGEPVDDPETLEKLARILADDIDFYKRWCTGLHG